MEITSFKIKIPNTKPILVASIFRHPKSPAGYYSILDTHLDQVSSKEKEIYLMGDMNSGYLINNAYIMYNNIESTVLNNGNTGNYFKIERGVRQGCPLSAYLLILAIEVLANKIRNGIKIKGIKINEKEIIISLLADDITLILKDIISLEHALNTLKRIPKLLWS